MCVCVYVRDSSTCVAGPVIVRPLFRRVWFCRPLLDGCGFPDHFLDGCGFADHFLWNYFVLKLTL